MNKYTFFLYISVMAESQVKSREAKVDFDEDILEGENAKNFKEPYKKWII